MLSVNDLLRCSFFSITIRQSSNVENLSPQILRQVFKEMFELSTNAPEGIKVQFNEAEVTDIQAVLEGPG